MQHCNRIYYSKNLLKAQHVLSGTPLIIRSSKLYLQPMVYIHMWWTGRFPTQPWRRPVTIWVYKPEATNSLELLMMSGVPLETCWAFNKLWNNKFYYKAASCWYFYWVKMEIVFYMPLTKRKLLWRGTTLNSMHVGYYPSGEIWRSRSGISDDSKPCGVWCRVSTEAVGESSASLSPYNLLLPRQRHQVASTKVLSHNWPKMLGRHMGAPLLFSTYALQPSRIIVRSGLDVPTFATRRLHACHRARAPSGGRWKCGREMSGNFAYMPISTLHLGIFYMP